MIIFGIHSGKLESLEICNYDYCKADSSACGHYEQILLIDELSEN